MYQYLIPLGLGILGLQGSRQKFNMFANITRRKPVEKRATALPTWRLSGAAALVLALAAILSGYFSDVARLRKVNDFLAENEANINIIQLQKENRIKTIVAVERPEIMEFIMMISDSKPDQLEIDSIHLQKGRPVNITGHTKNMDKFYEFEKNVKDHKEAKNVRFDPGNFDPKKKTWNFVMSFEFDMFARKAKSKAFGGL